VDKVGRALYIFTLLSGVFIIFYIWPNIQFCYIPSKTLAYQNYSA